MKNFYSQLLLLLICCLLMYSCNQSYTDYEQDVTSKYYNDALKPFYHGVASGDPSQNEVIIWTRVTPKYLKELNVKWTVSADSLQNKILQFGNIKTASSRDYTVKVLVSNLKPNTYYWYSFEYEKSKSIIGRTKTLPKSSNDSVRLIAVCGNAYEGGYFNAFRTIAEKKEKIDAIVHLGDYIYEGFNPKYMHKEDRIPLPKKELISLNDYRTRYAQYRLDPNLMLAHQMHPFINIWDDHEIVNDCYVDGAIGHNPEEDGSYENRKFVAKKSYYEWLPIKEDIKHYRSFNFGGIAELFMLDGRLEGRTKQEPATAANFESSERHILGNKQVKWLINGLSKSNATWKIIGNPVLFSNFDFSIVTSTIFGKSADQKIDSWSGYPYERNKLIKEISSNSVDNTVFLSGDSHCSWAFKIQDALKSDTTSIAIEIGVPAISSGSWYDNYPVDTVMKWEEALYQNPNNTNLKYNNLRDRGYVELLLTNVKAQYIWYFIDKDSKNPIEKIGPSYMIKKGTYEMKKLE